MTYGLGAWGEIAYEDDALTQTMPTAGAGERVLFLSPADSDAATIAVGSTAQLALANLQDMAPAKKWRSAAATTSDYITLAFASPVACNALALVAHNLTSAGWLRVRGANTAADVTASPVVDTKLLQAWPLGVKPTISTWLNYSSLIRWTNDAPLQYWRVDIADGGSGAGQTYLEAGRLALGRAWQPASNLGFDTSMAYKSSDLQINSPWNTMYTDARFPARVFDMRFEAHEQRDAFDGAMELQRRRGMAKDIIVSLDPAETTDFHRYTMQGVMTNISAVNRQPLWSSANSPLYQFSIQLQELIF